MIVNELSKATFTARPIDEAGSAFTPTNARYKLHDKASTNELIPWTGLTPSEAMEILIAATIHSMVDPSLSLETKVLTTETDFGTSNAHVEEFEYQVRNLQFVG